MIHKHSSTVRFKKTECFTVYPLKRLLNELVLPVHHACTKIVNLKKKVQKFNHSQAWQMMEKSVKVFVVISTDAWSLLMLKKGIDPFTVCLQKYRQLKNPKQPHTACLLKYPELWENVTVYFIRMPGKKKSRSL